MVTRNVELGRYQFAHVAVRGSLPDQIRRRRRSRTRFPRAARMPVHVERTHEPAFPQSQNLSRTSKKKRNDFIIIRFLAARCHRGGGGAYLDPPTCERVRLCAARAIVIPAFAFREPTCFLTVSRPPVYIFLKTGRFAELFAW